MLGFDPLSVLTAGYILASSPGCPAPNTPPDIQVIFTQNAPTFVRNLSSAQLGRNTQESDRKAERSTDAAARATAEHRAENIQVMRQSGEIFTGGYMTGGFQVKYQVGFKSEYAESGESNVCVRVDKIALEMIYSPTIYIASEYQTRPCANAIITAHEKNHLARDLLAISVSTPRLKQTLGDFLMRMGSQGPYANDETQLGAATQAIGKRIDQELATGVFDRLAMLRAQYQAVLDTPQNYMRESMLCPGWQWKIGDKK